MLIPMRLHLKALTGLLVLGLTLSSLAAAQQVCNTAVPPSTPEADFTLHNDGTVTHHRTGLMWMREPLNGTYTWEEALAQAEGSSYAGYTDWRLPNAKELDSIVEMRCYMPSINLTIFPSTPSMEFWSSTPFVGPSLEPSAWCVWFLYGSVAGPLARQYGSYVRLVRGGEQS